MRKATSNANQQRSTSLKRPPVLSRLLILWFVLASAASLILLVDVVVGLSLLWGCSVSLLPSVIFAWFGFRNYGGASQSAAALSALYRAEASKFLITAALFAAVFVQVERIYLPIFFLAFVCGQIGSWLVTARVLSRHQH